ncbi:MAG: DUF1015 domain-containing protein [Planctomycetota bacterium]
MASIEPFRGWLLHDPGSGDDGRCVAPPYDVIDESERDGYARLSTANVVHLTLPNPEGELDRYAAARALLERMAEDTRLTRDEQPCFYLQDVLFRAPGGETLTRKGLIGLVAIEPIGSGMIRGHEEVQPKPLADRHRLLTATLANLEPVFFLYSDSEGAVDQMVAPEREKPPVSSADLQGVRFELRRTDPEACLAIQQRLRDRPLYIADGHHRFTVAERFRQERPDLPGSRYRMALLVRAEDPGVVVLPTHRFVRKIDPAAEEALVERLVENFQLEDLDCRQILDRLAGPNAPGTFGVWLRRRGRALLARPKPAVLFALAETIQEPLRSLDVNLLHRFLLEPSALGHTLGCVYVRGEENPLGLAEEQGVPLAFFLTAPDIETILEVSDQGRTMPSKSTYFYPKAASGQVLFRLDMEP